MEWFPELFIVASKATDRDLLPGAQRDARYELTPSLLRKWDNGDWQFMPSEDRLCKEPLIAHHDESTSIKPSIPVMGAFVHSRFREAFLGEVKRILLDNCSVPILMTHSPGP
ncbi:universal stress protein [Phyllobacterium sp. SB3]|uniref:universal stress protein n=1 Tax=Phyllobacterium sp. SB3 TaxID=3156073 RepID=UPI0032AEE2CF